MNEKYEKIIGLSHHISDTRARMSRLDRAAQFAPYSALSGYEDAVVETARITDEQTELDEYEKERINDTLVFLLSAPQDTRISLTYFLPDERKAGGAYVTVSGEVGRIDEIKKEITGEISSLKEVSNSFWDGVLTSMVTESFGHMVRGARKSIVDSMDRSAKKAFLTNNVFKKGNYYYNWTWKNYSSSPMYEDYLNKDLDIFETIYSNGADFMKGIFS